MSTTPRERRFIKGPDDKAMKAKVEVLQAEIKQLEAANAEINTQIQRSGLDLKTNERKNSLLARSKEIQSKQKGWKSERDSIQEQIKNVDANMKRKINEIQKLTGKNSFKSIAEIDARIAHLENLIGSGNVILADEKRHVKEMSHLRKTRKDYGVVEKQQELIDSDKAKIIELKKMLNSIGDRDINQEYQKIQQELNGIFDSNKSANSKKNELYDKRVSNDKSRRAKIEQINKLRSDFREEFTKFKKALAEEQMRREEEEKLEQEAIRKARKKEAAEKRLAEASVPAFTKEINEIHNLLAYFDPTYVKPSINAVADATKATFETKNSIRQVEVPKDVVIIKKEPQSFFEGSKSKKNKKKVQKSKNFTVDTDIIASLSDLSISLPTKTDDIPNTVSVLKETLAALQSKQEDQTKANIEKAKAEIAKLEVADDVTGEETEDAKAEI